MITRSTVTLARLVDLHDRDDVPRGHRPVAYSHSPRPQEVPCHRTRMPRVGQCPGRSYRVMVDARSTTNPSSPRGEWSGRRPWRPKYVHDGERRKKGEQTRCLLLELIAISRTLPTCPFRVVINHGCLKSSRLFPFDHFAGFFVDFDGAVDDVFPLSVGSAIC